MPQHVYPACHELRGAQTPALLRNPDYEAQLFILVAPRRDMMDGEPEMLTVVRNSLRSSRACGKQIVLGHMDNWCPGWESNPSGGLILRKLLILRNSKMEKNYK